MVYAYWLWGFGLLFLAAERLWPRQRRPWLRRGLPTDLAYLVFNSEYLGVLLGIASTRLFAWLDLGVVRPAVLAPLPWLSQLAVILVAFDLVRW